MKFPLHNHDIVEVFTTATCENNEDMVKLALLHILEIVILNKERPTSVPVERIDMLDDIKYFFMYPWGTLSFHTTIKSIRGCPARRSNASHTYSITGFPLPFMFEVVGVMVPTEHEMPLVATIYHDGVRKPSDIAPVVQDKIDVDVDTDRVDKVHSVSDRTHAKKKDAGKRGRRHSSPSACTPATLASQSSPIAFPIGAAAPDIYRRHSALSPRTATEGTSVDLRLCVIEERLSIMYSRLSSMDNKQSSMDNRLSSMESKVDSLIKLLSSTYNTTGLDEDDDQCFDEVQGEDVGVGNAYRMFDQKIDHAANHLVSPVSISSSPIAESEHSVKVFTQTSDRKLAGGQRKRRVAQTIENPYYCQSLRRKMIHTLPVSSSVTFDPYRSVSNEVARQYAHFMNTSADDQTVELFWITVGKNYFRDMECSLNWLTSDHMETVTHLIRQCADMYPEVFDSRILLLDNRLSENYDFGEEMLEFLNGKEPMMKIKPCWEYDRILLPLNRDNNH
ncbi:hypothetical protein FNV43_RR00011 [Rhamnella rubrinervis]|uniref:DUF1985 domain-containing protein n=1 Tax=Rhamnella rubrinervis TaxID=2594499 RepID=A0A8K0HNR7_9ROSA|nr:hypothetical protein FNV43_RR00011 [Rhamnella rubrinervis]